MPRKSSEPSLSSSEIARLLYEIEIDSDPEYDARKRAQLSHVFALRLFPDSPTHRRDFVVDVTREVQP